MTKVKFKPRDGCPIHMSKNKLKSVLLFLFVTSQLRAHIHIEYKSCVPTLQSFKTAWIVLLLNCHETFLFFSFRYLLFYPHWINTVCYYCRCCCSSISIHSVKRCCLVCRLFSNAKRSYAFKFHFFQSSMLLLLFSIWYIYACMSISVRVMLSGKLGNTVAESTKKTTKHIYEKEAAKLQTST